MLSSKDCVWHFLRLRRTCARCILKEATLCKGNDLLEADAEEDEEEDEGDDQENHEEEDEEDDATYHDEGEEEESEEEDSDDDEGCSQLMI